MDILLVALLSYVKKEEAKGTLLESALLVKFEEDALSSASEDLDPSYSIFNAIKSLSPPEYILSNVIFLLPYFKYPPRRIIAESMVSFPLQSLSQIAP